MTKVVMEPFDAAWLESMPAPAQAWLLNVSVAMARTFEAKAAYWRGVEDALDRPVSVWTSLGSNAEETMLISEGIIPIDVQNAAVNVCEPRVEPMESNSSNDCLSELAEDKDASNPSLKSNFIQESDVSAFSGDNQQDLELANAEANSALIESQFQTLNCLTLDRPRFKREKLGPGSKSVVNTDSSKMRTYSSPSLASLMREMTQRRSARKETKPDREGEIVIVPKSSISQDSFDQSPEGEHSGKKHLLRLNPSEISTQIEDDQENPGTEKKPKTIEGQSYIQPEAETRTECNKGEPSATHVTAAQDGGELGEHPVPCLSSQYPAACRHCDCVCFRDNPYRKGRCSNCFHKHEFSI